MGRSREEGEGRRRRGREGNNVSLYSDCGDVCDRPVCSLLS